MANNNQQSLIHFISHQLKGFFTKSKMIFSGILEGDFGDTSPVIQDMAKTGLTSDNNAVAMIQDILGASNLKTGTTNYNLKRVDLAEIVKKIASSFTEEINKKGLKLETDISEEALTTMADETQITPVLNTPNASSVIEFAAEIVPEFSSLVIAPLFSIPTAFKAATVPELFSAAIVPML